jgi:hypothetical protein
VYVPVIPPFLESTAAASAAVPFAVVPPSTGFGVTGGMELLGVALGGRDSAWRLRVVVKALEAVSLDIGCLLWKKVRSCSSKEKIGQT